MTASAVEESGTGTTPPAGDQQQQGTTPPPATGTTPPANDEGRGSKTAILADLAKERDQRQALEATVAQQGQQLQEFLGAIGKALGVTTEEKSPAQLQEELANSQNEARENKVLLGVYAAAAQLQADPSKIMDSVRVREALKGVDPADSAKIASVIAAAVQENPHFKLVPSGAGANDAGAGGDSTPPVNDMNAWIRAAAHKH